MSANHPVPEAVRGALDNDLAADDPADDAERGLVAVLVVDRVDRVVRACRQRAVGRHLRVRLRRPASSTASPRSVRWVRSRRAERNWQSGWAGGRREAGSERAARRRRSWTAGAGVIGWWSGGSDVGGEDGERDEAAGVGPLRWERGPDVEPQPTREVISRNSLVRQNALRSSARHTPSDLQTDRLGD